MTSPRPDLSALPASLRGKLEAQLERLPTELRDNLHAQLAKVPPDQLARFVERSSPLLDKALSRVEQAQAGMSPRTKTQTNLATTGHYNGTVQPGDRPGLVGKILFVLAMIAVLAALL
jgi:hypothetical protein